MELPVSRSRERRATNDESMPPIGQRRSVKYARYAIQDACRPPAHAFMGAVRLPAGERRRRRRAAVYWEDNESNRSDGYAAPRACAPAASGAHAPCPVEAPTYTPHARRRRRHHERKGTHQAHAADITRRLSGEVGSGRPRRCAADACEAQRRQADSRRRR